MWTLLAFVQCIDLGRLCLSLLNGVESGMSVRSGICSNPGAFERNGVPHLVRLPTLVLVQFYVIEEALGALMI